MGRSCHAITPHRTALFFSLAVAGVNLAACATNAELRRPATLAWSIDDPPGVEIVVPRDVRTVFEAATAAIHALHLDIIESDRTQFSFILAERTVTAWSWGEVVAVYLRGEDVDHTRIRVESRRRLATNVTARDYTASLLASITAFAERIAAARAAEEGPRPVVLSPVVISR